MRRAYRVRQIVNWLNCSSLLGLLVGLIGRVRFERGPDGLIIGRGYRPRIPPALAFTVGGVVMIRLGNNALARRPALLAHEARHATQYAWCLGPIMLIAYALAAGWSWLRTGDPASRNVFERHAGLADGGYPEKPVRPLLSLLRR